MQEALNIHFQGLVFRERNAGRAIDAHMSDRGFNNQIGVHPETGTSNLSYKNTSVKYVVLFRFRFWRQRIKLRNVDGQNGKF